MDLAQESTAYPGASRFSQVEYVILLISGSGLLSDAEVYDAEVHGAVTALEAIAEGELDQGCTAINVMINNLAAVNALQSGKITSSA